MKKNPVFLAVTAVSVMVFGAAPALAAQMSAGDRPDTRGPIAFDDKSCARDVDKTTSGRRAVVTRGCSFTYDVRRGRDRSNSRDYGVFWFQTTVDPENGFCLTDVESTITVPRGYRIERVAPKQGDLDGRRLKTRLSVRGGGRGELGVVKNTFKARGTSYDVSQDGRRFTVDWRGLTRRTFALAMGVEVSYPQGDPPNEAAEAFVSSALRDC